VAAGLAGAAKKPKVLLLEAGGKNENKDLRVDGQRWTTFMNQDMNWGFKTTPQENCNGRECDYSRGKGLGGSSAINFGVYTIGAKDDYDEWARLVQDDFFAWPKIQERYKKLETFNGKVPTTVGSKYAAPKPEAHGTSGPLRVGYAAEFETDIPPMLDIFEQAGFPLNPDHNSGNPLGMSVLINSSDKGVRSTSSDLLDSSLENLTVLSDSLVLRVILEGTKCVGVETENQKCEFPCRLSLFSDYVASANTGTDYASKEVILSAGSLNNPQILMHSGIGPANQLKEFNLPVVLDVPAIGQGMRDHMFCPLAWTRTKGSTARAPFYGDDKVMSDALEQWKRDGTGPWAKFACELGIGWFKIPGLTSTKEFQELPEADKRHIDAPTVPHYEIITHFPIHWFLPGFDKANLNYSCMLVFYFNAQARGTVMLQSSDPKVPLKFDPKFLGTPFDRRVAVESLRDAFRVAKHEAFTKDNESQIVGPAGDSDEELLEYWKNTISSSWHMTGTIKMGSKDDKKAAVDSDFRLKGIEGLRVADMSVVPLLASCHVQAVAYVTGITCAEKLIQEYNLA
jgi:choline dehydrogenase-like flavoprotein